MLISDSNIPPYPISCSLCNESLDIKGVQSFRREVVKTHCKTPHYYHLECITQKFDALSESDRRCFVCKEQPLPLVRLSGVRPNDESPYCDSPATYACRFGNFIELDRLLRQDPEMINRRYRHPTEQCKTTLLTVAATFGQIECLKILLNSGPEKWQLDSALLSAVEPGHSECVKLLLNTGAITAKILDFSLEIASEEGYADCVEFLIDNGAKSFDAALSYSTKAGHAGCVKILLDKAPTLSTDRLNKLLDIAAYIGASEVLQLLIDKGANNLNEALISAAIKGCVECTKLLIDSGADDFGRPLSIAEQDNHFECQNILREKIASQNSQNESCSIQ